MKKNNVREIIEYVALKAIGSMTLVWMWGAFDEGLIWPDEIRQGHSSFCVANRRRMGNE